MPLATKVAGDEITATEYNILAGLAEGALQASGNLSALADRKTARVNLSLGAWISATDPAYAADPTAVADSTTALQGAMNAAASAGVGCVVPAGTFLAAGLSWPSGLKFLAGAGNDLTILKRPDSSATGTILTIPARADWQMEGIGFDGNKANNTAGGNNLVLGGACGDFQIRRVRSVNAKANAGYGSGIVLSALSSTNTTGRGAQLIDCEAYDNDTDGLTISQTGAGITVRGGVYSANGDAGIYFYDQAITPAADTVPNLLIEGVRAERNGSAGIAVLGFYVAGLGGVRTYGHGSDPAHGLIIDGCQANHNAGYGIFVQATGATISDCTARYNGTTTQAGICANADQTKIIGNTVIGNKYFGIDAGGSRYTIVSGNTISGTDDGAGNGTGLNLGACQHVEAVDNLLIDNGTIQINVPRYDAGTYWFPWETTDLTIARNRIVETRDTAHFGILCTGAPDEVLIEANVITWVDTTAYNAIRANLSSGLVRGNRLAGATLDAFLMAGGATLTLPEWADAFALNGAPDVTGIQTRSQQLAIQTIMAAKLTARGSGYTADFAVGITGGGGTGAAITARVSQDGRVAALQITAAGSGYTSAPTLDFSAGAGTGAAATAVVGIPLLNGKIITLVGYGAAFSVTPGTSIKLPGSTTNKLAINNQGVLRLRGSQGVWVPESFQMPGSAVVLTGSGSPEGVVTASVGALFLRTDGGTSTTLYVKTSGTGNTGWTAK